MAMCLGHACGTHSSLFSKLATQTFVPFWGAAGLTFRHPNLWPTSAPPSRESGGRDSRQKGCRPLLQRTFAFIVFADEEKGHWFLVGLGAARLCRYCRGCPNAVMVK